ncbi:alkaline phosphatase PhoX [Agaribacter marinus]|uniref:Phosphatase n=1 Tax=Agaribacter marinus TaxID=1431249 RepID=A0AA37SXA1_9ALTE|nr:alkaline phosphatase PhoX [Agaribacter marinus]GLR69311.1 phosphatase [Agaribacter marinus]
MTDLTPLASDTQEDLPIQAIFSRRQVLKGTGTIAASTAFASLATKANAATLPYTSDYGPLSPTLDKATGLPLISLPEGFEYTSFGWTGQIQTDGLPTPTDHDGMAVTAVRGNVIAIVRNHECSEGEGPKSSPRGNRGVYNEVQHGGTSTLLFDIVQGKFLSSFNSLGGTIRNCAGGLTPWGSWLSCEETFHDWNAGPQGFNHGYVFEVPGFGISDGQPIREMGRFSHEAAAVDPATGYVYETEDAGSSAFYKFVPQGEWGDLKSGGTLYAMVLNNTPRVDLRGGLLVGSTWDVSWQEVPDPDAQTDRCFNQAFDAAIIERGEGCWYDDGKIYFVSTSGGAADLGQIFCYDPRKELVTLVYESSDPLEMDGPDNIAISPRGNMLLCEDGRSNPKRLIGLTTSGTAFPFCENNISLDAGDLALIDSIYPGTQANFWDRVGDSVDGSNRRSFTSREWAGACFYGRWLFVNIQSPGVTFAIKGPWENGGL